ncbi:MAG: hypothetical protein QXX95_06645 [Nitrososphaerales archaeon]
MNNKFKLLSLLLTLNATNIDKAVEVDKLLNLGLALSELESLTKELLKDNLILSKDGAYYLSPSGLLAALSIFS